MPRPVVEISVHARYKGVPSYALFIPNNPPLLGLTEDKVKEYLTNPKKYNLELYEKPKLDFPSGDVSGKAKHRLREAIKSC